MKSLPILFTLITAAAGAVTYPIVDTGQTTAYGNDKGQDANYSGNAPAYENNGDGTITDTVTDLMWTQDPGAKMTFDDAAKNASNCRVGEFKDWRLPTIKELYSLIQLNGTDPDPMSTDTTGLKPFIDDSLFKFTYGKEEDGDRIIDSQFATSTKYVSTTMRGAKTMFGVNFADGRIKGYGLEDPRGRGAKTFYVLYVRGNSDYGKNKFKENGDGTIIDEATGLTWMKADSANGMDWPSALDYAENLELAGHSDWRLPNAKELQSIIDYTRSPDTTDSAAIDPIFQCSEITNEGGKKDFAHYWTSSTHVGARSSDTAVYFAFGRSLGFMKDRRTGEYTLMDVHGAGSQRSDPKVGDASKFPHGRGPQGDVIRIENIVRCVRGGDAKSVDPEVAPENQQSRRPQEKRPDQPQGGSSADRIFSRFDTDKDGQITKSEFKGPERRFNMIDQDKDGIITRAEAEAAPAPPNRREGQPPGGEPRPFDAPAEVSSTNFLPPVTKTSETKPNIVFIFADDMGWTGTSVEMIPGNPDSKSDYYQTPNLEKLAAQGMRFAQAYSPASLCTPSRAAVLTGKTPAELHITTPGGGGRANSENKLIPPQQLRKLPASEITIAEALSTAGYASAYLGKWHLGNDDPGDHGFYLHDGSTGNETPNDYGPENPKDIFGITERGIAFVKEQAAAGRPFFLQLSHYAVHSQFATLESSQQKFEQIPAGQKHNQPDYAGMTWDLDASIGTLLDAIDQLGISDNTYIIFMSDNGAAGSPRRPKNAPLNAGKGSLYEGGIRVPLIVRGPGIKPNSSCSEGVTGCDLFPTFCDIANVPIPGKIEGTNLIPLLTGNPTGFQRLEKSLLFHYPHYGQGPAQKPQSALIVGNYKLLRDLETGSVQLFDLDQDISESNDLSKKMPEKTAELEMWLDKRLKAVDAQLPSPNPDYDPDAEPQQRKRRNR